jgi:tripartite-type tricarboxylate transporter receptor subunit TctC
MRRTSPPSAARPPPRAARSPERTSGWRAAAIGGKRTAASRRHSPPPHCFSKSAAKRLLSDRPRKHVGTTLAASRLAGSIASVPTRASLTRNFNPVKNKKGELMTRFCVLLLSAAMLTAGAGAAAQEAYPGKPIRALNPFAPGGAVDITSRVMLEPMREILGQPIALENKPGAFGIIANNELVKARPDGYTIMFGNVNSHAIWPVIHRKKLPFDFEKEVAAVARFADLPGFIVATTTRFNLKTLQEVTDYAKKNPGALRYSSVGVGSFPHIDMALWAHRAGLQLTHIPNKSGASGMVQDLVTGDAQLAVLNVANTAPMVKAGQVVPLAALTEERMPDYPDVPTIGELGFPGVGTIQWIGVFASAKVPDAVAEKLHAATVRAVANPAVQDAFKKQMIRTVPTKSVADARQWLKDELAKWEKIAAELQLDLN